MSTAPDDETVSRPTAHYPPADITPAEFETFVAELLGSTRPLVDDLEITLHESITGPDGTYDFDCTVRYELMGMQFLVLVEAKRHSNPIKRELVQVLYQKLLSLGAHKAVMVATAPYQKGALTFAKAHGIALVTITEGRFTFETKAFGATSQLTRKEAFDRFGIPTFVGLVYSAGDEPRSTRVTQMSVRYPEYVAECLLGVSSQEAGSPTSTEAPGQPD